jgi:hypothetical protein
MRLKDITDLNDFWTNFFEFEIVVNTNDQVEGQIESKLDCSVFDEIHKQIPEFIREQIEWGYI